MNATPTPTPPAETATPEPPLFPAFNGHLPDGPQFTLQVAKDVPGFFPRGSLLVFTRDTSAPGATHALVRRHDRAILVPWHRGLTAEDLHAAAPDLTVEALLDCVITDWRGRVIPEPT